MGLFKKEVRPPFTAIKLYGLREPADREALLSSILDSIRSTFGALPVEYDICGPYGIKKGTTVGLKAFQNTLAKRGHDKYYTLSGATSGQFGFNLLLGARVNGTACSTYSELIVWYASDNYSVDFLELVIPLLEPLDAVCGFDIDIPASDNISTETKIKRSVFGSISVDVNHKHLAWLSSVHEGAVRGVFRNNVVNDQQLASLSGNGITVSQTLPNGLHYFHFPNARHQHGRS